MSLSRLSSLVALAGLLILASAAGVGQKGQGATLTVGGLRDAASQAKYICPTCQATYRAGGACLICEATLQPVESKK